MPDDDASSRECPDRVGSFGTGATSARSSTWIPSYMAAAGQRQDLSQGLNAKLTHYHGTLDNVCYVN